MDSTVYKKRPFRFPFDINPKIFLGLSVFFFIFSFKPILNLFVQKDSQEVVDLIQKDIFNQTNSIKSFATNKAKIKRILDSKTTNEDLKKLTSYPFYFFIIKNNKIHFWNNSIVNPLIDSIKNEPFCIKTLNGIYYVQNWKIDSQVYIQSFIPIKQEYVFYKNINNLDNKLLSNTKFKTEQFEFSIKKINNAKVLKVKNKPILYIRNQKNSLAKYFNYSFWDLFFNMFFFIAFGVAIHTYFKVSIQYESKVKIFLYQLITVLSIRLFTYLYHLPNDFSEFHIFNPTLFHLDIINCSLGDLFINVCLFFWILEFYSINVQSTRKFIDNKLILNLIYVLIIGLIILVNDYSVEVFKHILKSNINLEGTIQDIFYFPKFIALSSLLILVICNIFLILICNRYFEKINQTSKLKFILLIIFSTIYYFIRQPDNSLIFIITNCWILLVLY
nr:hypothetical protein [Chitinophagaceae bacterium]